MQRNVDFAYNDTLGGCEQALPETSD